MRRACWAIAVATSGERRMGAPFAEGRDRLNEERARQVLWSVGRAAGTA
jgi:hypothetical protein